jgi:hypothetical protein
VRRGEQAQGCAERYLQNGKEQVWLKPCVLGWQQGPKPGLSDSADDRKPSKVLVKRGSLVQRLSE